jgi:hypothetical protein
MSEIESHDVDDMAAGAECFDTCAPSAGTENWRVAVWFLILLPMAVAAWLKIGPIAGVIEVAWLLFVAFVRSQPRGPG